MYEQVSVNQFRETRDGTDLLITIPQKKLGSLFMRKGIRNAEIRFDDACKVSMRQ